MKISDAKSLVLGLISRDLGRCQAPVIVEPASPDPSDEGKFRIDGKAARIVYPRDGWYVKINLKWFGDNFDPPTINEQPFHWYVFAIPKGAQTRADHYFVCDYLQMRDWVRDFEAPKGNDHRDHDRWRSDLRVHRDEQGAYFRWGDEPFDFCDRLSRVVSLDNVASIALLKLVPDLRIGRYGSGGESEAHRALKLFIAKRPGLVGLSESARSDVEHVFATRDRVDVLFNNHMPERTVVEVEVEGDREITVGIHQAIKYRALVEAENRLPRQSPKAQAKVVAYETDYAVARDLASQYDVQLISVNRRDVLLSTG